MTGHLPPTGDDRLIWDIWESQFRLPVTTVADETGIFTALSDAARTTDDLAKQLALDPRALAILLAALASMDLIEKREGQWRALPAARTWLHPQAEGYWGGFLYRFRESQPLHQQLLEAVRTGGRPTQFTSGAPEWERGEMSAEAAQRIAAFMHAHSQAPARGAAAQPVFGQIESLMDDDYTGPWEAAAFSLLMLIGTLGKQYSLPEFRAILESAGFVDVQAVRTGGGYFSLVSGRKP